MASSAEQVKKEQQKLIIAQREARERREREAQQAAAGGQSASVGVHSLMNPVTPIGSLLMHDSTPIQTLLPARRLLECQLLLPEARLDL